MANAGLEKASPHLSCHKIRGLSLLDNLATSNLSVLEAQITYKSTRDTQLYSKEIPKLYKANKQGLKSLLKTIMEQSFFSRSQEARGLRYMMEPPLRFLPACIPEV